jgi:GNAT superfamily N-acetyltransferase
MTLTFRTAVDSDLPVLARMNRRLIEDEGSRNPMTVDELRRRMQGWLAGDWTIQLLVDQGTVLGYTVYSVGNDEFTPDLPVVYLRQFYIERENRNRGLGSRAFKALAQAHFPQGSTVVLDALASNPRGYNFWRELGFQPYCTTLHFKNHPESM